MALPGDALDGYRLIRPIGRGGFGEVWLCQMDSTGEFKALKLLAGSDPGLIERELAALIRFRSITAQIQSPHLLHIEHVNRNGDALYYVMPLADGLLRGPVTDPEWRPSTLAAMISAQREAPTWFTAQEIREIFLPLVQVVQQLSDAGVVHRDIKPENILFLNAYPCLGDISLLTNDGADITRRGTPGYAAPSWYLESGGNPDLWGLATTLYGLLTGNNPDKIGRAAFLWPPQGKASVDTEFWQQCYRGILRATHELQRERFRCVSDFALVLNFLPGQDEGAGPDRRHPPFFKWLKIFLEEFEHPQFRSRARWLIAELGTRILGLIKYFMGWYSRSQTLRLATWFFCYILLVSSCRYWSKSHPSKPEPSRAQVRETPIFESLLQKAQTQLLEEGHDNDPSLAKFNAGLSELKALDAPDQIEKKLEELEILAPSLKEALEFPNRELAQRYTGLLRKSVRNMTSEWDTFTGLDAEAKLGEFLRRLQAKINAVRAERERLAREVQSKFESLRASNIAWAEEEEAKLKAKGQEQTMEIEAMETQLKRLERQGDLLRKQKQLDESRIKKTSEQIKQLNDLLGAKYLANSDDQEIQAKALNLLKAKREEQLQGLQPHFQKLQEKIRFLYPAE